MMKRCDGMSGLNCIHSGGALRHSGGGGAVGSDPTLIGSRGGLLNRFKRLDVIEQVKAGLKLCL